MRFSMPGIHSRQAGDQNDRDKSRLLLRLDDAIDIRPCLLRHQHIEYGQVDRLVMDCIQSFLAVSGENNRITLVSEDFREKLAIDFIVIGDQDCGLRRN